MFDCIEYKNILGQMRVVINTTTKDWNRLLETGLWDKAVGVLNDEPKSLEERVFNLEAKYHSLSERRDCNGSNQNNQNGVWGNQNT